LWDLCYTLCENLFLWCWNLHQTCPGKVLIGSSDHLQTQLYSLQSKLTQAQILKIWRAEQISSLRDDFLTFIQSKALSFSS
jgi:hypothetical protein